MRVRGVKSSTGDGGRADRFRLNGIRFNLTGESRRLSGGGVDPVAGGLRVRVIGTRDREGKAS